MKTKKSSGVEHRTSIKPKWHGTDGADDSGWVEIEGRKEEFIKIVRLLVEYDEKTGRAGRGGGNHYLRAAIAHVDPADLRLFARHKGAFAYEILCTIDNQGGYLVTTWIHEDGIPPEREGLLEFPDHPVHSIVCLTDLMEGAKPNNPILDPLLYIPVDLNIERQG